MTRNSANSLSDALLARAFATVEVWLHARDMTTACIACGAEGLAIENHSVPPYAEWYHLSCATCGLDAMIMRQTGGARGTDPI